jgi:hypothetical protein
MPKSTFGFRPITFNAKFCEWIACIKRQFGIASQVSVIKVKVAVTKSRNLVLLHNMCLLWPVNTKLGVWVAYIKRQLEIATQVSVVKVIVTKNRNSVSTQ